MDRDAIFCIVAGLWLASILGASFLATHLGVEEGRKEAREAIRTKRRGKRQRRRERQRAARLQRPELGSAPLRDGDGQRHRCGTCGKEG